ncbi:succinyl-diaminopimelate desuccinylase [Brevibacterium sp.]|uniref:succinyl-diaminopimelate desuccinylase n=1 Tax=Brevibacterium sp. TaxID=1701 RepID=UPI0028128247|nr:succinyl-diaminopimelate desuccinylase [Brevibacterium sp.]
MTVDPTGETGTATSPAEALVPAAELGAYLFEAIDDPGELTARLCAIESVSGNEAAIADAVAEVLARIGAGDGPDLEILRDGDTIVARTRLSRPARIVVAGHLDTVPVEDNLPPHRLVLRGAEYPDDEVVWGRGACDMKAGVAMALVTAAALRSPKYDISWVFYDNEEVDAARNGLGRVSRNHPEWLEGDFAILGEPSNASVEGGCNGTIRVDVTTAGVRAHSARAFMGVNAIHAAAEVLTRLAEYESRTVTVDGLDYRESLSAVNIRGGIAGNVVPDECVISVNYRFAPNRSTAEAEEFLRDFFTGFDLVVTDAAEGARPGLDRQIARDFIDTLGLEPAPKLGWTDVSRFSALGVPAVNFGPGNPLYAHKSDEHVRVAEVDQAAQALLAYLEEGSRP